MDRASANAIEILGLAIIVLAIVMTVSVVVMLASRARFAPITLAAPIFICLGTFTYRAGKRS